MQSSFLMVLLFYLSSWTEVMMDSFSDVRRRLLLHQEAAARPSASHGLPLSVEDRARRRARCSHCSVCRVAQSEITACALRADRLKVSWCVTSSLHQQPLHEAPDGAEKFKLMFTPLCVRVCARAVTRGCTASQWRGSRRTWTDRSWRG